MYLKRQLDSSDPTAKSPVEIPRESKILRVVKVEVQPKPMPVQEGQLRQARRR